MHKSYTQGNKALFSLLSFFLSVCLKYHHENGRAVSQKMSVQLKSPDLGENEGNLLSLAYIPPGVSESYCLNTVLTSNSPNTGEGTGNPLQYSCLERLPGTGEPGGLLAMGSHRAGHD